MRSRTRAVLAVIATTEIAWMLGCGVLSVPRVAVEGTTVLIPVPKSFRAGFGRVLNPAVAARLPTLTPTVGSLPSMPSYYGPDSVLEDELRGELVFQLRSATNQAIAILPVRYITRVQLDEASAIGDPADDASYWPGQILALVDIPLNVVAANPPGSHDFTIQVHRYIRNVASPYAFQLVSPQLIGGIAWRGWGGGGVASIPIKIYQEGTTTYPNPFEGADAPGGTYFQENIADDLQGLVPKPTVGVYILEAGLGAWEAEIEYPRGKVKILGAQGVVGERSAMIASFIGDDQDDSDLAGCAVNAGTGRVKVGVLDPRGEAGAGVRLVLVARPFVCPGTAPRFEAGDLAPDASTLRAYDVDGNDLSGQVSLAVEDGVL